MAHVAASPFRTYLGVDLGGGKGKHTAVARLVATDDGAIEVRDYGTGRDGPWFDDALCEYLISHKENAVLAIDAPLTLPPCVRCTVDVCPGFAGCPDPDTAWFMERAAHRTVATKHGGQKPIYTPYTQRPTEVLLHEDHAILPRETLGQGMGPLTARAAHLCRVLRPHFQLNANLLEVYPKATIWKISSPRTAQKYKRSAESPDARLQIWNELGDLKFAPGAWREDGLQNDHKFDAVMCAYTAFLWAKGLCEPAQSGLVDRGWIWIPKTTPRAQL